MNVSDVQYVDSLVSEDSIATVRVVFFPLQLLRSYASMRESELSFCTALVFLLIAPNVMIAVD